MIVNTFAMPEHHKPRLSKALKNLYMSVGHLALSPIAMWRARRSRSQ